MSKRDIPIDEEPRDAADAQKEQGQGREEETSVGSEATTDAGARLQEENARLQDQLRRAMADFENYKRRAQQEREQFSQYANERLLRSLLPILDDMKRSIEAGAQSNDFEPFYKGVSMIGEKLQRTFESIGVEPIQTVGEEFDVELHEALMRQPSDSPEGTVIGELEPGYTYNGRVLRHAKVIVSAG